MFNAIARPFGVLLMYLYDLANNYGIAIILIALVIKVILLPFQMKSKRGMMQQARLQPQIAELQKKHGANKAKLNEETMKLYKEEGVNPASGCIWGFLPLPIMLALFQVIRQPITTMMGVDASLLAEGGAILAKLEEMNFSTTLTSYYVQIAQSQFISDNFEIFRGFSESLRQIDFGFLGLNLGITPQWDFLWNANLELYGTWLVGFVMFLIPLISGGTQFLSTQLNKKLNPQPALEGQAKSMNSMLMFMPLMSVYIAFITPGALGFYWTVSTIFQVLQDVFLTKIFAKKIEAEEAKKNEQRRIKEAEIEAKRLETERRKADGLIERNPNTSKRKKQKSDRQGQLEKAAEWQKKKAPDDSDAVYEPSRVGNRRYARGRAYDPDRYGKIDLQLEIGNFEPSEEDAAPEDADVNLRLEISDSGFSAGIDVDIADDNDYDDSDEDYDSDDDGDEDYDSDDDGDEDYDSDDDGDEDYDSDDDGDDDTDGDDDDDMDNASEINPTVRFDTARFDKDEE